MFTWLLNIRFIQKWWELRQWRKREMYVRSKMKQENAKLQRRRMKASS